MHVEMMKKYVVNVLLDLPKRQQQSRQYLIRVIGDILQELKGKQQMVRSILCLSKIRLNILRAFVGLKYGQLFSLLPSTEISIFL